MYGLYLNIRRLVFSGPSAVTAGDRPIVQFTLSVDWFENRLCYSVSARAWPESVIDGWEFDSPWTIRYVCAIAWTGPTATVSTIGFTHRPTVVTSAVRMTGGTSTGMSHCVLVRIPTSQPRLVVPSVGMPRDTRYRSCQIHSRSPDCVWWATRIGRILVTSSKREACCRNETQSVSSIP